MTHALALAAAPPNVVVIDDTEGNRYAVARLLRGAGMKVAEAENGRDGLKLAHNQPDLILVDVNLPDMSGYDVVRALRADAATASIPIMHISASFIGTSDKAQGLEGGADAYITHPVEPVVFLATVRALVRAGQAEAKTRQAAIDWIATFDTIRDAIVIVEDDGTVRRCNAAAAEILRNTADDIVGEPLGEALIHAGATAEERDALMAHLAAAPTRSAELGIRNTWYSVTVDRLEQNSVILPSAIVCVLTDITARKATELERESLLERADQARNAAEVANRSKSDFLAVASHELRTPLNAIAGFVQLLALGIRGPVNEAQLADLEKIRRSQVTLTSLINDLLSFARLERGAVTYDIGTVDLNATMVSCAEMIEALATERHLAFRAEPSAVRLNAMADADKVQQVLLNMLSNALKFTPAGGSVVISGALDEHHVLVRVADTGTGIPADKLEAIFDPFVQVDQRRVRAQEGIGLGLSISRELSRAMGGDLTVQSTLGRGSTFTLRLPRA
jgi:PAS domain S-box-containing protein